MNFNSVSCSIADCEEGEVRLVDGRTQLLVTAHINDNTSSVCQYNLTTLDFMVLECNNNWTTGLLEGRVEICQNHQYGTICDDRWDELEARIVCRQLQHISQGM